MSNGTYFFSRSFWATTALCTLALYGDALARESISISSSEELKFWQDIKSNLEAKKRQEKKEQEKKKNKNTQSTSTHSPSTAVSGGGNSINIAASPSVTMGGDRSMNVAPKAPPKEVPLPSIDRSGLKASASARAPVAESVAPRGPAYHPTEMEPARYSVDSTKPSLAKRPISKAEALAALKSEQHKEQAAKKDELAPKTLSISARYRQAATAAQETAMAPTARAPAKAQRAPMQQPRIRLQLQAQPQNNQGLNAAQQNAQQPRRRIVNNPNIGRPLPQIPQRRNNAQQQQNIPLVQPPVADPADIAAFMNNPMAFGIPAPVDPNQVAALPQLQLDVNVQLPADPNAPVNNVPGNIPPVPQGNIQHANLLAEIQNLAANPRVLRPAVRQAPLVQPMQLQAAIDSRIGGMRHVDPNARVQAPQQPLNPVAAAVAADMNARRVSLVVDDDEVEDIDDDFGPADDPQPAPPRAPVAQQAPQPQQPVAPVAHNPQAPVQNGAPNAIPDAPPLPNAIAAPVQPRQYRPIAARRNAENFDRNAALAQIQNPGNLLRPVADRAERPPVQQDRQGAVFDRQIARAQERVFNHRSQPNNVINDTDDSEWD